MNGQLSKEINFEILFRNLEHVLFCEIFPMKFHLFHFHCDWSVGQCLQTSNELSVDNVVYIWLSKVYFQRESAYFQKKNYESFISK